MRIFVSVAGFFPAQKYGGPAVSIRNMCNMLCNELEIFVVTVDHEFGTEERLTGIKDGWNKYENYFVMYLPKSKINKQNLKIIINDINPDCIYVNSLFDYRFAIPLLKIACEKELPLVLAPRGEICKNSFRKKYKKIPYILYLSKYFKNNNIYFEATAEDEKIQIEKYLVRNSNSVFLLPNVPSLGSLKAHLKQSENYLSIIFLARIQRKKNLVGALEILKYVNIPVRFDIYGPKEVPEYWKMCQSLIDNLPENIVVNYNGAISHNEVAEVMRRSDLYLFPTFSENYGHTIIEALQEGTPVLISDQTPWMDLEDYGAGWAYPLQDRDLYVSAIKKVFSMKNADYEIMSNSAIKYVKAKFDMTKIKKMYMKMFSDVKKSNNT